MKRSLLSLALVVAGAAHAQVKWDLPTGYAANTFQTQNNQQFAKEVDELTGGKLVHIYGQQEVVKDLIAARLAASGALLFITKLRVSPDAAFSMEWTSLMFFAVVIGGIGTLEGPILGALVYFALREWLSDQGSWYLIVLGLLTVAVVLWAPGGIWGALTRRWDIHLFPVRRRVLPLR